MVNTVVRCSTVEWEENVKNSDLCIFVLFFIFFSVLYNGHNMLE